MGGALGNDPLSAAAQEGGDSGDGNNNNNGNVQGWRDEGRHKERGGATTANGSRQWVMD